MHVSWKYALFIDKQKNTWCVGECKKPVVRRKAWCPSMWNCMLECMWFQSIACGTNGTNGGRWSYHRPSRVSYITQQVITHAYIQFHPCTTCISTTRLDWIFLYYTILNITILYYIKGPNRRSHSPHIPWHPTSPWHLQNSESKVWHACPQTARYGHTRGNS